MRFCACIHLQDFLKYIFKICALRPYNEGRAGTWMLGSNGGSHTQPPIGVTAGPLRVREASGQRHSGPPSELQTPLVSVTGAHIRVRDISDQCHSGPSSELETPLVSVTAGPLRVRDTTGQRHSGPSSELETLLVSVRVGPPQS